MINDTIGDSLSRIRNAIMRNYKEVLLYNTKMVMEICRILKENKFIIDYAIDPENKFQIIVKLTQVEKDGIKLIKSLKRISKPGLRIYRGYLELERVLNGYGIAILSTAKGVMTDTQARKEHVGGEVLCEIY